RARAERIVLDDHRDARRHRRSQVAVRALDADIQELRNGPGPLHAYRITPYGQFSRTTCAGSFLSTSMANSVSAGERACSACARSSVCSALPNIGGSSISPSNLIAPPRSASASIAALRIAIFVRISEGEGVNATLHGWICDGWI